jgi:hypothetical protein
MSSTFGIPEDEKQRKHRQDRNDCAKGAGAQ